MLTGDACLHSLPAVPLRPDRTSPKCVLAANDK